MIPVIEVSMVEPTDISSPPGSLDAEGDVSKKTEKETLARALLRQPDRSHVRFVRDVRTDGVMRLTDYLVPLEEYQIDEEVQQLCDTVVALRDEKKLGKTALARLEKKIPKMERELLRQQQEWAYDLAHVKNGEFAEQVNQGGVRIISSSGGRYPIY